jgi:Protein of unknown function (DUF2934)
MPQTSSHSARSSGRSNGTPAGAAAQRAAAMTVSDQAIAQRAYEKFLARGGAHGFDQEDWTEAERELTAEARGA